MERAAVLKEGIILMLLLSIKIRILSFIFLEELVLREMGCVLFGAYRMSYFHKTAKELNYLEVSNWETKTISVTFYDCLVYFVIFLTLNRPLFTFPVPKTVVILPV